MLLQGRAAIVTGSGGAGCGRAIALRFAREGATVIVSDIDVRGAEETLRLIEAAGGRAAFHPADIRKEEHIRELIAFAVEIKPLGVLVNNATAPFAHGYDMENWLTTAETDFVGPLLAIRWAVEAMRKEGKGGAIVNVSSISALWHGRKTVSGAPFMTLPKRDSCD